MRLVTESHRVKSYLDVTKWTLVFLQLVVYRLFAHRRCTCGSVWQKTFRNKNKNRLESCWKPFMTNQITPCLSLQKQFISKLPNNINTPFSCSRSIFSSDMPEMLKRNPESQARIDFYMNSLFKNKRIISIVITHLPISSCIYSLFSYSLISQRSLTFWLWILNCFL